MEITECGRCDIANLYGLMSLCDFYPLPAALGKSISYLYKMIPLQRDRMTIYVAAESMRKFVNYIAPQIQSTFILVTANSDMTAPAEALSRPELRRLLASPLLIRWYAQNKVSTEPKISHWPLGVHWPIDNRLMGGIQTGPLEWEAQFLRMRAAAPAPADRIPLIYSRLNMRNDRFDDRWLALDTIPAELFAGGAAYVAAAGGAPAPPLLEFWRGLGAHAFCLSPFGYGIDCYRTWEALAMGAIPIVRCGSRRPFEVLFAGLPVLAVAEWRDVTRELLDRTLIEFRARYDFNALDKTRLQYWREVLRRT